MTKSAFIILLHSLLLNVKEHPGGKSLFSPTCSLLVASACMIVNLYFRKNYLSQISLKSRKLTVRISPIFINMSWICIDEQYSCRILFLSTYGLEMMLCKDRKFNLQGSNAKTESSK